MDKKWKESFCFNLSHYYMRVSMSREISVKTWISYYALQTPFARLCYHSTVRLHSLIGTSNNSDR